MTAAATVETCHLFRIPAELRNRIYELCFVKANEVNLLEAMPPSKALLLTCRQIHDEARLMRRRAYRDYWFKTRFFIQGPEFEEFVWTPDERRARLKRRMAAAGEMLASLTHATKDNIAHIRYLRVSTWWKKDEESVFMHAWVFADGMWTCWTCQLPGEVPLVYKRRSEVWFFPREDRIGKFYKLLEDGFDVGFVGASSISVNLLHESEAKVPQMHQFAGPQVLSVEALTAALKRTP